MYDSFLYAAWHNWVLKRPYKYSRLSEFSKCDSSSRIASNNVSYQLSLFAIFYWTYIAYRVSHKSLRNHTPTYVTKILCRGVGCLLPSECGEWWGVIPLTRPQTNLAHSVVIRKHSKTVIVSINRAIIVTGSQYWLGNSPARPLSCFNISSRRIIIIRRFTRISGLGHLFVWFLSASCVVIPRIQIDR